MVMLLSPAACTRGPAGEPAQTPAAPQVLHVAVAASVHPAAEALSAAFSKVNPGVTVETTPGSSGGLAAQILHGAPFDLFLSADTAAPTTLVAEGKALAGSYHNYASGELILWARPGSPLADRAEAAAVLHDARLTRLAIANPKLAPYGRAAETALAWMHATDAVREKIVLGENAEQAAQFALTGAADAALVPASLAAGVGPLKGGTIWSLPGGSYNPIVHAGAIVSASTEPDLAGRFFGFIRGPDGQAILRDFAFAPPPPDAH